jgi:hypothetical protein
MLVEDLRPVRRGAALRRLLVWTVVGALMAQILVGVAMGYRSDLFAALLTTMFWIKLGYVASLGGLALAMVYQLARPGLSLGKRLAWLAIPVVVLVALAAWQLARTPSQDWASLVMGVSARACPWLIVVAALAPLGALVMALRSLAPTRPLLAGWSAGIAAGGLGASAYALHCGEVGGAFVAIWYSLGVLMVGGLGAVLGRGLLRW